MHRKEHLSRQAALAKLKVAHAHNLQQKQSTILRNDLESMRGILVRKPVPLVEAPAQEGKVRRRDARYAQPRLKEAIDAAEVSEPFILAQGGLGDALLAIAASYRYMRCKIIYGCNNSVMGVMGDFFSAFGIHHTILPTFSSDLRLFGWLANHPYCMSTCHIPDRLNYGDWGVNIQKYETRMDSHLPLKNIFGTIEHDKPIITLSPGSVNSSPDSKLHKQRSITKDEYFDLVSVCLKSHAVYVTGTDDQRQEYGMVDHPDFHWMTFNSVMSQTAKKAHEINEFFAVVNSSEIVISVDTWLKTYSMMANIPTIVLQSRSHGKYVDGPIDSSDNIFLSKSLWDFELTKVEDLVSGRKSLLPPPLRKSRDEQNAHSIPKDATVVFGYYVSIGDFLMMTPALKAMKEKNPESPIYIAITKESNPAIRDVFRDSRDVDKVLTIDASHAKYNTIARGYKQHKSVNFCLAIQKSDCDHAAVAYAKLCGVEITDTKPLIHMRTEDYKTADQYGIDHNYIAIHAGRTDWPGRNWVESRWEEVCRALQSQGWKVVSIGGGKEHPISGCDVDLTGKTTLHQAAAVIERCACTFGTDSSMMHLSIALNKPTVGLFGCVDPKLRIPNDPWFVGLHVSGLDCLFCWSAGRPPFPTPIQCKRNRVYCMEGISTKMAVSAIERAIKQKSVYCP